MEKSVAISLLLLLTAVLASSAPAVQVGGCSHNGKESPKPPTSGGSHQNTHCEYKYLGKQELIHDIMNACDIIIDNSSVIHEKLLGAKSLWATVGLYTDSVYPSGQMLISDVHYNLAASVSIFQTFLRPVGLALTEETVREVVHRERNTVYRELPVVFSSVAIAANKTYQLVMSDPNIHQCIVPHLPANQNVTLRPFHPDQILLDSTPKQTLIVDGLMNELQRLAMSVRLLLFCMDMETGSCDFP